MGTKSAKTWKCRLGLHDWRRIHIHERDVVLKECRRCGKRLGTGYPPHLDGGGG
jgi:hypothetical protein